MEKLQVRLLEEIFYFIIYIFILFYFYINPIFSNFIIIFIIFHNFIIDNIISTICKGSSYAIIVSALPLGMRPDVSRTLLKFQKIIKKIKKILIRNLNEN